MPNPLTPILSLYDKAQILADKHNEDVAMCLMDHEDGQIMRCYLLSDTDDPNIENWLIDITDIVEPTGGTE